MPGTITSASSVEARPDEAGSPRALEVLLTTIDAFDAYTGGHSDRVATFAGEIARLLGLSYAAVNLVRRAGFVHDIGKIFIPETIINKPGALTDEERDIMRLHAELGARMLQRRPGMTELARIVLHHHERWDGHGYPIGLTGNDIPLESRIIFAADAFDAMTSERPYRRAMTRQEAVSELRRCAGQDFDPQIVRTLQLALYSGAFDRPARERTALLEAAG